MIHDGANIGKPIVLYPDTQANINALTGIITGTIAYAYDVRCIGTYNGASWDWTSATGTGGGGGGSAIAVYDNGVLKTAAATGLDFLDNIAVFVSGTLAYINLASLSTSGTSTYIRVGTPVALTGATGTYWKIPEGIFATGTLAWFLNGVAQSPVIDYSEQYYYSGTYQLTAMPPTGSVHTVMWGVPIPQFNVTNWQNIGCRVYRSVSQTLPNATGVAITFDVERWDTNDIHSNVTNNSRLVCPISGTYSVAGNVIFAANTTGARRLYMMLNGTIVINSMLVSAESTGFPTHLSTSTLWSMNPGDYLELYAYQNSGGNLNLATGAAIYAPEFMMQKVG